jgi:hypothetical protein
VPVLRFQCPDCGLGDYEVGQLTHDTEVYCIVCHEENGRIVRLQRWEEAETAHARFRLADAA